MHWDTATSSLINSASSYPGTCKLMTCESKHSSSGLLHARHNARESSRQAFSVLHPFVLMPSDATVSSVAVLNIMPRWLSPYCRIGLSSHKSHGNMQHEHQSRRLLQSPRSSQPNASGDDVFQSCQCPGNSFFHNIGQSITMLEFSNLSNLPQHVTMFATNSQTCPIVPTFT